MDGKISTRFMVLSDTHGDELDQTPREPVDVLIHCGGLTEESKLAEYRRTIRVLKEIPAALKLVIAGNHDFTLDIPTSRRRLAAVRTRVDPAVIKREYGDDGDARALFEMEDARAAGIVFLYEGFYRFRLVNGALLTVYASPYTPSSTATIKREDSGFRYDRRRGHKWAIPADVDVVVTHQPPKGILDVSSNTTDDDNGNCSTATRTGDGDLYATVARVRPQMHCFGHVHGCWGARKVTWRSRRTPSSSSLSSRFLTETIDDGRSRTIECLSGIEPRSDDSAKVIEAKRRKLEAYRRKGYCFAGEPPQKDVQTMFVNAAIEGKDDDSQHLPWIIDLRLPRCGIVDEDEEEEEEEEEGRRGNPLAVSEC